VRNGGARHARPAPASAMIALKEKARASLAGLCGA